MDNCTLDCIQINGEFNATEMCLFTESQCLQDTIQFVQAYFCAFNQSFLILILLVVT